MIGWQEVLEFAADFRLDPQVVEKDYVLDWLLAGIGQHAGICNTWLFKGGCEVFQRAHQMVVVLASLPLEARQVAAEIASGRGARPARQTARAHAVQRGADANRPASAQAEQAESPAPPRRWVHFVGSNFLPG